MHKEMREQRLAPGRGPACDTPYARTDGKSAADDRVTSIISGAGLGPRCKFVDVQAAARYLYAGRFL